MATFQKLTDVTVTEVISEQANVFVEDGGELRRVAKSQVGGAGSLADLKDVVYFYFDTTGSAADATPAFNITCNKTFDEVLSLILNHELKMVTGVVWYEGGWNHAQVTVNDWWLTSEDNDGSKVFDSSAGCIAFSGSAIGQYGQGWNDVVWYMNSDGSITTDNSGEPS